MINAIRLIKRFFSTTELLQLITSNLFSVLYYNSEIWHLHSLKSNLKKMLLSASARAVKICVKFKTDHLSFIRIHSMYNRATPEKFLLYKHALTLFKLINTNDYTMEWAALNFNQILTSRQTTFKATSNHRKRVGLNALANRVFILNDKIPLKWFGLSLNSFKIHCKKEFLSY